METKGLRISRRALLRLAGIGLLSNRSLSAQDEEPRFASLDHIEFYVSDVLKSRDFFARIFGTTLKVRTPKRYLKLGATYMAFEPPRGNNLAGRVDHVSVAVRNLEMPRLHTFLDQRGVAYQDYPSGRDTGVTDADSIRLQLSPENGWSLLNPATFPPETVSIAEPPIFRAIGLDHILLNVSDPAKSIAFYTKFLGQATPGNNNRVWFQVGASRIGLLQTPAGERPGVNHFCVSAEPFDYDDAVRKLKQLTATVEDPEIAGAPQFRDPDGLLIQVMGRRP